MEKWIMFVVAFILGMLVSHMLKNVYGSKNLVEGLCQAEPGTADRNSGLTCKHYGSDGQCTSTRMTFPGSDGEPMKCREVCAAAPSLEGIGRCATRAGACKCF